MGDIRITLTLTIITTPLLLKMGMKKAPLKVYFQKCLFFALLFLLVILTFLLIPHHCIRLAFWIGEYLTIISLPPVLSKIKRHIFISNSALIIFWLIIKCCFPFIPKDTILALFRKQPSQLLAAQSLECASPLSSFDHLLSFSFYQITVQKSNHHQRYVHTPS